MAAQEAARLAICAPQAGAPRPPGAGTLRKVLSAGILKRAGTNGVQRAQGKEGAQT